MTDKEEPCGCSVTKGITGNNSILFCETHSVIFGNILATDNRTPLEAIFTFGNWLRKFDEWGSI